MRQSCAGERKRRKRTAAVRGCGTRQVQSHPAGMRRDKEKWDVAAWIWPEGGVPSQKASREFTLHLQTSELPVCLRSHNCCMTVFCVCVCRRVHGGTTERESGREGEGGSAFLPSSHSKPVCHGFFCCTLPEINASPFTAVGRWCCHPARPEGGPGG